MEHQGPLRGEKEEEEVAEEGTEVTDEDYASDYYGDFTDEEGERGETSREEVVRYIETPKRARWCVCSDEDSYELMNDYYGYKTSGRRCCCCRWRCLLMSMAISLGLLLAVLAWWDDAVRAGVLGSLAMTEGSQRDRMWRSSEVEVMYTIRVFNLTNPRQFMDGALPRVRELGPYAYRMRERKENVVYRQDGTVEYQGRPLYYFEPSLSKGSEEDMVTTLNIPFVNAAELVKDERASKTILKVIQKIYGFSTLRSQSVGELLWGHRSRVLDWARTLQDLPYPYRRFGLLMGLNDTLQMPYLMHTGKGDPAKTNRIVAWNGHEVLDFWYGDVCNMIRGTDANGFSPGVSKEDTLYVFNGQLCRSLPLVYNSTVVHAGLDTYRFVHPDSTFAYGPKHPENSCYCGGQGCPPTGVLDMKPCYFGASVGFSFPHFYKGDPKLRHIVRGLRPDPKKHRTEFDIFPDLGVPIRARLRMQMNVLLDREMALGRARHYDVALPIFWFDVGVDSLPEKVVGLLKMAQDVPQVVKTTSVTLCTTLTLIFLLLLLAQTMTAWCGWRSSDPKRRAHTPEELPHNTHYRPNPHPPAATAWEYDELHKPPRPGDAFTSYSPTPNGKVFPVGLPPQHVLDVPIIDDHTLLPPYRRHSSAPPNEDTVDQVPPPYSLSPQTLQRSASTVSVEIHTTASDEELADLPLDPAVEKVLPLRQPCSEEEEEKEEEEEEVVVVDEEEEEKEDYHPTGGSEIIPEPIPPSRPEESTRSPADPSAPENVPSTSRHGNLPRPLESDL